MPAVRLALGAVVASVALVACGGDDSSLETLATEATEPITTPTTEDTSTTTPSSTTTTTATSTTTTSTSTTSTTTASTTTTTTATTIPAPESATYRVTLVLEWSPATHPETLPPGWHTSPAVLAAHQTPGDMVPLGGTASPGIESMAETGKTAILTDELAASPAVGGVDTGQRVDGAGADELEVVVARATPLLSLVTMLAPSPDWFVGVVDLPLFENGQWTERIELDLIPWDAGTDSGTEFTSDNADTEPREPIAGPREPTYIAASAESRFGYVVIERIG